MKLEKLFLILSLILVLLSSFHFGKRFLVTTNLSTHTDPLVEQWPQFITWQAQKNLVIQELLKPYPSELIKLQGYLKITSQWQGQVVLNSKEVIELLSHFDTQLSQSITRLPESRHKESYLKQLRDSEDQIRQILAKK